MVIKRIPVRDLKPGMICANNTYNTLDQLVVPKDCVLNEQIIDRLLTYGILELAVKMPELEPAVTVFNSEIVKKTPEFKQFKNNYSEATDCFKSFLNSFVDADSNPDKRTSSFHIRSYEADKKLPSFFRCNEQHA